jgi:large subunit ribosomal protein LX
MSERTVKVFRVKGEFPMGARMQPFTKELASTGPDSVREKLLSEIGSKHKVKRAKILIHSIEEIPPEDAEDPSVKFVVGE